MEGPNAPLVSVITPSFNAVRFIRDTIQSVLDQDCPCVEHIVVDGGSTDGTVDILREYPHLRWISEPDRGQSDALNKGFRMARGEIIGWLNADDTYASGAVTAAADRMNAYPEVSVVYGGCAIIDGEGREIGSIPTGDFSITLEILGNYIPQPTVFMRRRAVAESGGVDENLHYVMDYDLWLRLAAAGCTFSCIDREQAHFRICPGTKTMEQADRFWPEILDCYGRFFSSQGLPVQALALEREAIRRTLWQGGLLFFASGDQTRGREWCQRAVREGHLLEDNSQWAIIALVDQTFGANRSRGIAFARLVLDSLELGPEYAWFVRHVAPSRLQEAEACLQYNQHEYGATRRAAIASIILDARQVTNRGLRSMLARSVWASLQLRLSGSRPLSRGAP